MVLSDHLAQFTKLLQVVACISTLESWVIIPLNMTHLVFQWLVDIWVVLLFESEEQCSYKCMCRFCLFRPCASTSLGHFSKSDVSYPNPLLEFEGLIIFQAVVLYMAITAVKSTSLTAPTPTPLVPVCLT